MSPVRRLLPALSLLLAAATATASGRDVPGRAVGAHDRAASAHDPAASAHDPAASAPERADQATALVTPTPPLPDTTEPAPIPDVKGAWQAPEPQGRRRLEAQVLPMVDEPPPPHLDEKGSIPLSLQDAIELAIAHELDIHSSRLDLGRADASIVQQRGAFDPVLNSLLQHDHNVQPSAFLFSVPLNESTVDTYERGIAQKLWFGGSYDVGIRAVRTESNSSRFSPSFSTDLTLKYTQPLLRGFGRDANRSLLAQAINSAQIADYGVKTRARDIVRDTIRAYWELVFAIRDVEVRRASLGLAQELLRKNRIMVEVGTLAPLEVSQAEASVANREFRIISAENAVGTAEDNLRRLMGVRRDSAWWNSSLVPTDEPEFAAISADLDQELTTAAEHRLELPSQQLAVENAKLGVAAAKDALLPQLDLQLTSGNAGLTGVSDATFSDSDPLVDSNGDGDPTNDPDVLVSPATTGSFGSSFDQTFGRDFESYSAALIWTQPLRNRAAEGAYLSQRLALESARLAMEQLRQSVTLEVRAAVRNLDSARESVVSAGAARQLQEKTLSAEIKKFENGLSTNFEVLQFQTDLQESESAEVRTLIDYLQAQAELRRARGTLLEDYGLAAPERDPRFTPRDAKVLGSTR